MTNESQTIAGRQGWLNVLLRSREGSLILLIAVMTVVPTSLNPRFISPQSLKDLMLNVSIIALLVLGQTEGRKLLQEDSPNEIGAVIAEFVKRLRGHGKP